MHIGNNSVDNVSNISKKTHKKLFENVLKQIKSHNNVFDYDKCKEIHKKLFQNVLKQIKSVNKVHKQDNAFDYDKCKKILKELFNEVVIELASTNNTGHKDSSAIINEPCTHDIQYEVDEVNNNLLNNHILYSFNKIKKIEKGLGEHNKNILSSLDKKYPDNRVKLNELKKVNSKLNSLLEGIC